MKKLKTILILLPFLALNAQVLYATCSCNCCECITYAYDDAGNRISRDVIDLSNCMTRSTDTTQMQSHTGEAKDDSAAAASLHESASSGQSNDEQHPPEEVNEAGYAETFQTGNQDNTFTVYPNPTAGKVMIEAEPAFIEKAAGWYHVFDLQGRELLSEEVDEQFFSIDFTPFEQGSYIVRFQADGYSHEVKIVVSR